MGRSKMQTLVAWILLAMTVLVLAGCGDGEGKISVPPDQATEENGIENHGAGVQEGSPVSGFTELISYEEGEITVAQYQGTGTDTEALERFSSWAEGEGWTSTGEDVTDIPFATDMYSGAASMSSRAFRMGGDGMVITAIDMGGQIFVLVGFGPEEAF